MNRAPQSNWKLAVLMVVLSPVVCCMAFLGFNQATLEANDEAPAWSPEGKHVAFVCYRKELVLELDFDHAYYGPYSSWGAQKLQEICVADLQGENQQRLTNNHEVDFSPEWSPDGKRIAFLSMREDRGRPGTFVMNADGTNQVEVAAVGYSTLQWSPDGSSIAYIHQLAGSLYIMRADGTDRVQVSVMSGVFDFDWSPDGRFLAFNADSNYNSGPDIYLVDTTTYEVANLTEDGLNNNSPSWAPDNRRLVFSSGKKLLIVDTETGEITELAETGGAWTVDWSPDGLLVAALGPDLETYSPSRTLYIVDTESGDVKIYELADGGENISWSHDSRHVVFTKYEDRNGDDFTESKIWVLRVSDGERWSLSN